MLKLLLNVVVVFLLCLLRNTTCSADPPDLRVTRGLGPKGYEKMRVSVITHGPQEFYDINFTYSAKFQYRWTAWPDATRAKNQPDVPERWLHSMLVNVGNGTFGGSRNLTIGGYAIEISLPPAGKGSRGIIISDPCFTPPHGVQSWIDCKWSTPWNTYESLIRLLEGTAGVDTGKGVDYWTILGDNFYDQNGAISDVFFRNLSLKVKSKPLSIVIGNHDMWIEGGPSDGDQYDQHGNGMMQYYALDPASSISSAVIKQQQQQPGLFLDFSLDPDVVAQWNGTLNTASNLVWYNAIGDTAYIGVSGAFSEQVLSPHLNAACAWLASEIERDSSGIRWLFLLGHWDKDTSQQGEQCDPCSHMSTPSIYQRLRNTSGCREFGNRLKYMDGHTHCNYVQEVDAEGTGEALGLMIGGSGMDGCGQFGFEYVDSTENQLKVFYFELEREGSPSRAEEILTCIEKHGIGNCTELAKVWYDSNSDMHSDYM